MGVEHIDVIIKTLDNHYRRHVEKSDFHARSKEILSRRSTALTISGNAADISEIYEGLRKSGDSEAMQAFRDTMVKFSLGENSEDFVHFVHTAEDLAKTGLTLLRKIFSTVSDIEQFLLKQNLSLDAVAWLSNLGYLSNNEIESYLDATEKLLFFKDNDAGNSFRKFIDTTEKLVKGESADQDKIDNFLSGTKKTDDSEQYRDFYKSVISDED